MSSTTVTSTRQPVRGSLPPQRRGGAEKNAEKREKRFGRRVPLEDVGAEGAEMSICCRYEVFVG
jgi:hypothetical protein